jgi:hypothetical protein
VARTRRTTLAAKPSTTLMLAVVDAHAAADRAAELARDAHQWAHQAGVGDDDAAEAAAAAGRARLAAERAACCRDERTARDHARLAWAAAASAVEASERVNTAIAELLIAA